MAHETQTRQFELTWQEGNRSNRARLLSLMYLLGGLLSLFAGWRHTPADDRDAVFYGLGFGALLISLALRVWHRRAQTWQLLLLSGSFSVCLGVLAAVSVLGVGVMSIGPAVIGVALHNACFCTRRGLLVQMAIGISTFVIGASFSEATGLGPAILAVMVVAIPLTVSNFRLTHRLRWQGAIDPLTGLFNRSSWLPMAERELSVANGRPMTVALIDMDDFKSINDVDGHQAGDDLLKDVAASWLAVTDSSSLLARYGGDEFVVLFVGVDAEGVSQRLATLAEAHPAAWSFGVATAEPGEGVIEVLARADAAMFAAKQRRPDVDRRRALRERRGSAPEPVAE